MYDGQRYELVPGKEYTLPDYVAHHLKKHSIYRDNPITGEQEYRVSILEEGDSTETVDEIPRESLDRADMDMPNVNYQPTGIKTAVPQNRGVVERLGSLPK
jgi:hypothetical protein